MITKMEPTRTKRGVQGEKKGNKKARQEAEAPASEQTYVSRSKSNETLDVLARVFEAQQAKNNSEAEALFETKNKIFLQIQLKKIPPNTSTFIHSIVLPHHWRHEEGVDYDVCLIVKDLHKPSLPDREEDLEASRNRAKIQLDLASAGHLITDVLPMRQLKFEFETHAQKKKLAKEYAAFVCDKRLMSNKHSLLSRVLGKQFWIDAKNVPVGVNLNSDNLKQQLETKLNETHIYMSGKGSTLSVAIGLIEQQRSKVLANLMTVLENVKRIFNDNVRSLGLKTEKCMEVIFFMDLGSSNEVEVELPGQDTNQEFVEDEFDMLTRSRVKVFRDGTVTVEADPYNDDPDDDEEPDEEERKLILSVNDPTDKDIWMRRKVLQLPNSRRPNKQHKF